ncbi:MAG: hypothetical protein AAF492_20940, partial [Verrucomicrobiota bacterium]
MNIDDQLYDFRQVDADSAELEDGFRRIQERTIDGFHIKNVFSGEELNRIQNYIDRLYEKQTDIIDVIFNVLQEEDGRVEAVKMSCGFNYPQHFACTPDTDEGFKQYFANLARIRETFPVESGVDFEGRTFEVIARMAGGRKVRVEKGLDDEGSFLPYNVRSLSPEVGHIVLHCGNWFQVGYSTFYQTLGRTTIYENQLSYFVVIQEP